MPSLPPLLLLSPARLTPLSPPLVRKRQPEGPPRMPLVLLRARSRLPLVSVRATSCLVAGAVLYSTGHDTPCFRISFARLYCETFVPRIMMV